MNQILKVFAALLFAAIVLCACNGKKPINWQLNKDEHWKLSDSGEVTGKDVHEWKNDCCTICGAEMTHYEAETWIVRYNEFGNLVRKIVLDATGAVLEDIRSNYNYDGNGNIAKLEVYEKDVLTLYQEFTIVSYKDHENSYKTRQVNYNSDGSRIDQRYDYNGWIVQEACYNASGEKEYDYTYAYIVNSLGQNSKALVSENGKPVYEIEYSYNEAGHLISANVYQDGMLIRVDHYDENGNVISED